MRVLPARLGEYNARTLEQSSNARAKTGQRTDGAQAWTLEPQWRLEHSARSTARRQFPTYSVSAPQTPLTGAAHSLLHSKPLTSLHPQHKSQPPLHQQRSLGFSFSKTRLR